MGTQGDALRKELADMAFDAIVRELRGAIGTGSIIVHARPRGGKGTQCRILAELVGGETTSSGDLFRAAQMDPKAKASLDGGDVVDSALFAEIVLSQLGGPEYDGKMLWLDAVGRKHGEEVDTMRVMAERGHPVLAVVYIDVSEDETRRRGHEGGPRGRADDTPEKHEHRLAEFERYTAPVIQHYRDLGLLVRVDGEQSTDDVTRDIVLNLHLQMLFRKQG